MDETELDPADIFSSSLEALYEYPPVTIASAGSIYEYHRTAQTRGSGPAAAATTVLRLTVPDTSSANWALHASDIWASSRFLADHIAKLGLDRLDKPKASETTGQCGLPESRRRPHVRVLELGAGAGLPGILMAKIYHEVDVTVSDYPDELLMKTLWDNILLNGVRQRCRAVGYAWGTDPAPLLANDGEGFDVVVATDTLWNSTLHNSFVESLRSTLRRKVTARVQLVAGLHTGPYVIQSFLDVAKRAGFDVESIEEMEIIGNRKRSWTVEHMEDDEGIERRRWVVWIVLRWAYLEHPSCISEASV